MAVDTTAYTTKYTALITAAVTSGLLDDIQEIDCLFALQCYVAALDAEAASEGSRIINYSMSNRSFTYDKRNASDPAHPYALRRYLDLMLGRQSRGFLTSMNDGVLAI